MCVIDIYSIVTLRLNEHKSILYSATWAHMHWTILVLWARCIWVPGFGTTWRSFFSKLNQLTLKAIKTCDLYFCYLFNLCTVCSFNIMKLTGNWPEKIIRNDRSNVHMNKRIALKYSFVIFQTIYKKPLRKDKI